MTQMIIDQTEQQPTYQKFQLVWAKILGWPWWPARITQIPFEKNGNYRVQFFADTTHAFLSSQKLISFIQGRDRHSTPKVHYRNFTKALGLANKLLQSTTITKDDLQSECSSKEKVVAQQIQIINYSQQAKTETKQTNTKIQQQNKISLESVEKPQAIRKPNSTFRRLQRSYLKHKQQMHIKTQEEVSKLLIKYKLEQVSDRSTKKQRTKFMKKRKLITKNRIEYSINEQLIGKLARMIFKALSTKKIDLQQKYKITLTLKDSFFKNKEKGVEGIHRALFQWIRCNDSQTIQQNYNSWPTDIKSDPFTDYS